MSIELTFPIDEGGNLTFKFKNEELEIHGQFSVYTLTRSEARSLMLYLEDNLGYQSIKKEY